VTPKRIASVNGRANYRELDDLSGKDAKALVAESPPKSPGLGAKGLAAVTLRAPQGPYDTSIRKPCVNNPYAPPTQPGFIPGAQGCIYQLVKMRRPSVRRSRPIERRIVGPICNQTVSAIASIAGACAPPDTTCGEFEVHTE